MTTNHPTPQYAAHAGRITLTHADTQPHPQMPPNGATTWWADGTTSYLLHFRSGHTHGWTLADETDTVIQAVDSLRLGEEISPDRLSNALRDLRRLRTRLEAVEGELILYAREKGAEGGPRLTFREIGEELGLNHTTVMERHGRMMDGRTPEWRHWLVQHTDRDTTPTRPTEPPTLREQMETAPGGAFLAEAIPMDPNGYVITVTDYNAPEPEQLLRVDLDEWDYFRSASAGHRLIEKGFAVLPAAHFERDRAAGWKAGPDGLTYSAPVYRLPEDAPEEEPPGTYCACADPNCPTPDGQYTHG